MWGPVVAGTPAARRDGEPASVRRRGLADSQLRFSYNFLGAAALGPEDFRRHMAENPVNTTAGVGISVTLPTGEYRSDRLINLGGNRWVIRPEIGVLHQRKQWQFELTGSVFIFGDNDEFWKLFGDTLNRCWGAIRSIGDFHNAEPAAQQ